VNVNVFPDVNHIMAIDTSLHKDILTHYKIEIKTQLETYTLYPYYNNLFYLVSLFFLKNVLCPYLRVL